jgi:flagellar FliL protein
MLAKVTGNKKLLGALVGVLGGLIVAVLLVVVGGVGRAPAAAEASHAQPTAKAGVTAKEKARTAGGHGTEAARFGPTYTVKDRIVNLADPGGRRYLRFTAAIEFAEHEESAVAPAGPSRAHLVLYVPGEEAEYQEMQGGREKDTDKAFQAQIKKYAPAIEDAVTTVLSAKTYDEVRGSDGKETAKREIKERVQQIVGEAQIVTNVYFTDLVVQ